MLVAAGFLSIVILFIIFSSFYLQSQFYILERSDVTSTVEQFQYQIHSELALLEANLLKYSSWNRTYFYIVQKYPEYTSDYLPRSLLSDLSISGIVIMNRKGDLILSYADKNLVDDEGMIPPGYIDLLHRITLINQLNSTITGKTGIYSLEGCPLMIASNPVLLITNQGTPAGSIHFIRVIDTGYLQSLSKTFPGYLSLNKIDVEFVHTNLPPDIYQKEIYPVIVNPVNSSIITGSFMLPCELNQSGYWFNLNLERPIYQFGQKSLFFSLLFLIITGLIASITVIIFMDHYLLSRMVNLTKTLHERLKNEGSEDQSGDTDELETLANAIDPLFARIAKTQNELKEKEKLFHQITDSIHDGILIEEISGPDSHMIYANPSFYEIMGIKGEIKGIESCIDLALPEEKDKIKTKLSESYEKGKEFCEVQFWIERPDNERRFIECHHIILKNNKRKERSLFVIHDLTEQKLAETALVESEAKFRFMAEHGSDVHWQTSQDLIITYISPADERMRGYKAEEVIGKNIFDHLSPSYHDALKLVAKNRQDLLIETKKIESYRMEVELRHKNKDQFWADIVSNPIIKDGNLIGFHGIYRDITERKMAEEAISQANNKLKLLSSITRHDVVNQISVIMSSLDLLEEEIKENEQKSLIEIIYRASKRVASLIQFSRDYQDIGMKEPGWFLISDLVLEVVKDFSQTDLAISESVMNLSVFADSLLKKVFYNLIENSVRHGEGVQQINIEGFEDKDGFHLIYRDDGPGIADDMKSQIFERGVGRNTGMGLFLIREILSITGITIQENGIFGQGAHFEMIIPHERYVLKNNPEHHYDRKD